MVQPSTATLHLPSQPRAAACRDYLALVYTSSSEDSGEVVQRLAASEAEVGWCQDQTRPGRESKCAYRNNNVHLSSLQL